MNLTHFHFSSCTYGHQDVELNFNKKSGLFEYRNRYGDLEAFIDFPNLYSGRSNPLEEKIITKLTSHNEDLQIDPILVDAFVKYVKQYCRHWKKEYYEEVMDGESWDFRLKTKDFEFQSSGHMAWPGNYETFRDKLMRMTGGKMF